MLVEAGPDRKTAGVVHWRRVDLKAVIEDRFGVVYQLSARPRHPAQKVEVLPARCAISWQEELKGI